MAWTWSELMVQMNSYHLLAREEYYDADGDVEQAWDKYWEGSYNDAIFWLVSAGRHFVKLHLYNSFWYPYGLDGFDSMQEALFKLTDARFGDISPEITMDAILSAMLQADPVQVEYFIGLVDAYKQSIWNRPFNEEFFAALGRGFMEWP